MEDKFVTICVSVFALAVVPAQQHPQTTYVPHARPGVGNGGGQRVRQGTEGSTNPNSVWLLYIILTQSLHLKYTLLSSYLELLHNQ